MSMSLESNSYDLYLLMTQKLKARQRRKRFRFYRTGEGPS